ncbi:MAG TPA: TlpA disulfide reductase family protein [Burkholderiales bacterium]|nr:TlpA disulfide reductase family protein [Burkholderiales bacterium]
MRALLLACLVFLAPQAALAQVLSLPDLQGRMHRLSDYRGKVVLLNFWASWCAPCRAEMPSIENLRRELRGEPFTVLAVNVDEDASAARRFAERADIGFTVLVDGDGRAARAWGARALPTTFIIGPDGRVRYSHIGARDWSDERARKTIEGLMTKPPLQTAVAY